MKRLIKNDKYNKRKPRLAGEKVTLIKKKKKDNFEKIYMDTELDTLFKKEKLLAIKLDETSRHN